MLKEKDLDPAFPFEGASKQFPGMSRADFFAAHAPKKIPKWFKDNAFEELNPAPVEPKCQDLPEYQALIPLEVRELESWRSDPIYDLPDNLEFFQKKWNAFTELRRQWHENKEVFRYFAWRQYYGQMMADSSLLEKPIICQE